LAVVVVVLDDWFESQPDSTTMVSTEATTICRERLIP